MARYDTSGTNLGVFITSGEGVGDKLHPNKGPPCVGASVERSCVYRPAHAGRDFHCIFSSWMLRVIWSDVKWAAKISSPPTAFSPLGLHFWSFLGTSWFCATGKKTWPAPVASGFLAYLAWKIQETPNIIHWGCFISPKHPNVKKNAPKYNEWVKAPKISVFDCQWMYNYFFATHGQTLLHAKEDKFPKGFFLSLGLPREMGWWRCCTTPHGPHGWDKIRSHAMPRTIAYCSAWEGKPRFFTKVQVFLTLWNFPPPSQTGFSGFRLVSMRLDEKASQQQDILLLPFVFGQDSIPLTLCPLSMSVDFSLVLWVLLSSWKASS